jgi:hypothetical protein
VPLFEMICEMVRFPEGAKSRVQKIEARLRELQDGIAKRSALLSIDDGWHLDRFARNANDVAIELLQLSPDSAPLARGLLACSYALTRDGSAYNIMSRAKMPLHASAREEVEWVARDVGAVREELHRATFGDAAPDDEALNWP